jgi:hypothetical protein
VQNYFVKLTSDHQELVSGVAAGSGGALQLRAAEAQPGRADGPGPHHRQPLKQSKSLDDVVVIVADFADVAVVAVVAVVVVVDDDNAAADDDESKSAKEPEV